MSNEALLEEAAENKNQEVLENNNFEYNYKKIEYLEHVRKKELLNFMVKYPKRFAGISFITEYDNYQDFMGNPITSGDIIIKHVSNKRIDRYPTLFYVVGSKILNHTTKLVLCEIYGSYESISKHEGRAAFDTRYAESYGKDKNDFYRLNLKTTKMLFTISLDEMNTYAGSDENSNRKEYQVPRYSQEWLKLYLNNKVNVVYE